MKQLLMKAVFTLVFVFPANAYSMPVCKGSDQSKWNDCYVDFSEIDKNRNQSASDTQQSDVEQTKIQIERERQLLVEERRRFEEDKRQEIVMPTLYVSGLNSFSMPALA